MTRRCVIFDLDGVLVESEPYWREGFRAGVAQIARRLDRPVPSLSDDELVQYEGGRVPDTLTRLARHLFALDPDQLGTEIPFATDTAIETALTLVKRDPSPIVPSVETARTLVDEGYVIAVASSSAPRFIEAALEAVGLTDVVAATESAFFLERSKPDPLVYLNALRAIQASAEQTIAVEDSRAGVEAAVRAGLRTIWVTNDPSATLSEILGDAADHPRVLKVGELTLADVHDLFEV